MADDASAGRNDEDAPAEDRLAALTARVERLEAELARLHAVAPVGAVPPPPTGPRLAPPAHGIPPVPGLPPPPPAPPPVSALRPGAAPPFAVTSETALKWGGVALVVLAVVFAVSTAISRGWIGPLAQLAGAVAFSLALVALGWRLRSRRMPWTHALCTGGVLALDATFASSLFRDELGTRPSLVALVVVAAAGFALAHAVPSAWVASAVVLGGHISWLVANGEDDPPFGRTLAWVIAVSTVAIALSVLQDRPAPRVVAHVTGAMLLAALASYDDATVALVLLGSVPLAASMVVLPSRGTQGTPWGALDIAAATIAAPLAWGTIGSALELDDPGARGALALVVAAVFAIVLEAWRARFVRGHRAALVLSTSITVTVGLALVFRDDAVAMAALAVQGAALVTLWRRREQQPLVLANGLVLTVITTAFAVGQMVAAWDIDSPIGDDLAHLVIIAAVAAAAWAIDEPVTRRLASAAVLSLTLLWLGSVLVHLPQGQAVVSVSWAVVGIGLFVVGATRRHRDAAAAGLAVIGLTVGKLLTIDLQEVDALWRAGLFLVVGLGLLRLGFLLPSWTDDDEARQ